MICTENTLHYITNDDNNENDDDDYDDHNVGFIHLYLNKSYVHMIF